MQTESWSFPVELQKIFTASGKEIPRARTVIRVDTGTPLSIVGKDYQLYTHEEMVRAADPWIKKFGKPTTSFTTEREGARLIVIHKFTDQTKTLPKINETIGLELRMINSYNASTSLEFQIGARVLKCMNGMTLFDDLFSLKFKHLGQTWNHELPDPAVIELAFDRGVDRWEHWSEKKLATKQRSELIESGQRCGILPKRIYEQEKPRFQEARNLWELYNAFTYVTTHKTKASCSGKISRERKLNRLFEAVVAEVAH